MTSGWRRPRFIHTAQAYRRWLLPDLDGMGQVSTDSSVPSWDIPPYQWVVLPYQPRQGHHATCVHSRWSLSEDVASCDAEYAAEDDLSLSIARGEILEGIRKMSLSACWVRGGRNGVMHKRSKLELRGFKLFNLKEENNRSKRKRIGKKTWTCKLQGIGKISLQ